ncbi:hypothetical protein [Tessaracoccus palaemonis]|uniref:Helix-turn-helix domain-containing protein n=1 Tax=Tessaracoccus palaemonis TaxID=2829499 RepID=A0ABX8SL61_9ACTN|nr:hypothetical protein [Tessaracoccus palaemonis]QXT62743.1 hypothetical protein KDB89_13570 [Tessaracoccus palaemonis]
MDTTAAPATSWTSASSQGPLHCARGCTRPDRHLSACPDTDTCPGCEPRLTEVGHLCRRCHTRLERYLGDDTSCESIAGAARWLADNLGQHLRSPRGGRGAGDSIDRLVSVADAMSGLQIALVELAEDYLQRHVDDTTPAAVAARLRPWATALAAWEPISGTLDHLDDLMHEAHAVAPWRGRDPHRSEEAAAALYLAPAESTEEICTRFAIAPQRLWKARQRNKLTPFDPHAKPLSWRPWDVFAYLHPDDARRYEAILARPQTDVVWTSESAPATV